MLLYYCTLVFLSVRLIQFSVFSEAAYDVENNERSLNSSLENDALFPRSQCSVMCMFEVTIDKNYR